MSFFSKFFLALTLFWLKCLKAVAFLVGREDWLPDLIVAEADVRQKLFGYADKIPKIK